MKKQTNFRIGILDVLFMVFLTLKLTNLIDWSWWKVCIPLFISIGLGIICAIIEIITKENGNNG